MVVYQRVCVVIRSRLTTRNLLIQAWVYNSHYICERCDCSYFDWQESFAVHRQGVDVRAATNAVQEAAVLLEQASQSGDVGDVS